MKTGLILTFWVGINQELSPVLHPERGEYYSPFLPVTPWFKAELGEFLHIPDIPKNS